MVDALGAMAAKKQALLAVPRRKLQTLGRGRPRGAALLTLFAGRSGWSATSRSSGRWVWHPVRALVPGVVERVLVKEGARVARGCPRHAPRHQPGKRSGGHRSRRGAAERQAALAASRGDAAEERLHRIRGDALRQELALLDEEVRLTTLRAPVAGMVLHPAAGRARRRFAGGGRSLSDPGAHRYAGAGVRRGPARLLRVRPGQQVRLRVDALPQRTFTGRVTSVGQLPVDSGQAVSTTRYARPSPIREGLLRPEMAAHARVLTDPASARDPGPPGPGPLGAACLVETLGMRRLAFLSCCSRPAADRPAAAPPRGDRPRAVPHRTPSRWSRPIPSRSICRSRFPPSSTSSTTPRSMPARPAIIEAITVDLGSRVAAGQLLARLESTDQRIALAQAERAVRPTPSRR